MDSSCLFKISKYLSKHLRHQPDRIGIKLTPGGWVPIDELLTACANNQFPITRQELNEVVATNDKKRFSFDSTGILIRANQGHSVKVDLQLKPVVPPEVLYHGTGHKLFIACASYLKWICPYAEKLRSLGYPIQSVSS